MNAPTLEQWLENNQRYLSQALAEERAALETFARGGKPQPAPKPPAHAKSRRAPAFQPNLERLCEAFRLSPFERRLLLWCAGAELDAGFAAALAEAQRDPARPFATFGLALAALPGAHWSALSPAAALRYWRLVEPGEGASVTQAPLRVDERILHYLTGVSQLDERLLGYLHPLPPPQEDLPSQKQLVGRLGRIWSRAARLEDGLPAVQLCGPDAAARRAVAGLACAALGVAVFEMPARLLPQDPHEGETFLRLWEREALLGGSVLLLDWEDVEAASAAAAALNLFLENTHSALLLSGRSRWPATGRRALVALDVPAPTLAEQRSLWQSGLGVSAARLDGDLDRLLTHFNLDAPAIRAVCASIDPQEATFDRLWEACREQSHPRLDDLGQRIFSSAGWDDLVLPPLQSGQLRQVAAAVRQRARVYQDWGFAERSARGLGISALFSGPSGTGKTLAAEVLANELRLDLYRIDLSQVVSKYIGETEKNLRRVFEAAESGGAILFFDEADALFGKRSEVKDSHDRYANIEVSYLLQRMEAYRGLAILTSNLPEAIDPAFLRRLRFIVNFPFPGPAQRAEIWRRIFPTLTPLEGLDFDQLSRWDISGGSIHNIALQAAFLAAETGGPVCMNHLNEAAHGEFMRLDKPIPFPFNKEPI
jgi:hypothetical protein